MILHNTGIRHHRPVQSIFGRPWLVVAVMFGYLGFFGSSTFVFADDAAKTPPAVRVIKRRPDALSPMSSSTARACCTWSMP